MIYLNTLIVIKGLIFKLLKTKELKLIIIQFFMKNILIKLKMKILIF